MFVRYGGEIRDGEEVIKLVPDENGKVFIKTSRGIYQTESVVLCLGPWAPKFLRSHDLNLPLQVKF